jgi:hypothetical protein
MAPNPGETLNSQLAVLLIDAQNGFNKLSRKAMLWTVQHWWPSGSQFSFNCYCHAAQLIIRQPYSKPCSIIPSREGITQGDPLSMVLYGLALTPIIKAIHRHAPGTVTPWYADNGAIAGTLPKIATAFALFETLSPCQSYYPEPTKSICLYKPDDFLEGQAQLLPNNFDHWTGHRYLGGHLGDSATRNKWLLPQIDQFTLIETALAEHFLPALLEEMAENLAPLRKLTALLV